MRLGYIGSLVCLFGLLTLSGCTSRKLVAIAPPPIEYTVTLRDATGSVDAIAIIDPKPDFMNLHADRLSLTNPEDDVVRVGWLGGRCPQSTTFDYQRVSGDLTLTYDLGAPCEVQVGVPHYFEITFADPTSAGDVTQRSAHRS